MLSDDKARLISLTYKKRSPILLSYLRYLIRDYNAIQLSSIMVDRLGKIFLFLVPNDQTTPKNVYILVYWVLISLVLVILVLSQSLCSYSIEQNKYKQPNCRQGVISFAMILKRISVLTTSNSKIVRFENQYESIQIRS